MQLKQIATISAGYPFRGKILESAGTGVVAVQMKDVSEREGIQWSGCMETELTGKREPDWLKPGDILVAARGGHNYAALITDQLLQAGTRAVAAPQFFIVRSKQDNVLPEYLVWFLNQQPCQRYFEQNAEGSLTKSIRRTVAEEAPIAVPPLAKQQTIIGLARAVRQEQRIAEQLISNGERLQSSIAKDLLDNKEGY
ncbi:restriction endonuclease subunit S [Amphritea atlantica]|uniref:Restriction endonuclease subunit S n=1 Tax=Amphritea atlantica TaxID=355243 RepID=A0ABY5GSW2_9GAMM|nr:restriction endonuclease subunit S [Amphritea atlantica]